MKNKLTLTGVVVLILSLIIFTGCAEKKSVVTSETAPVKEAAPTPVPKPTPDTTKQINVAPSDTTTIKEAASDQSSLADATAKSPIRDINFDYDNSSIRPDAREILKVNADYLLKHRVSSIVVEGHCDERGTAEYNMALGQRRAQETKTYLVNLGIKESIIRTISYGAERPLYPESNEEAWAKNRRAHFVVTP
ncbi:MAG: peptidoglycan-associated lipoprotein [Deltaproteobacteria bacterium HGW-Deltaproteobacteria-13]|jgi:peptidoglycan-associated lipoprotein|nr:MAG: peptidoglycan-associated lipoprotein [Deltaproteobacteria bacterium HGW-Deltaproteobacteria-13]